MLISKGRGDQEAGKPLRDPTEPQSGDLKDKGTGLLAKLFLSVSSKHKDLFFKIPFLRLLQGGR